jgi:hypothetical protein
MRMGLSVSRPIIESHRGRLWAEPNQGPGATFSFAIPRSPRSHARRSRPSAGREHLPKPPAVLAGRVIGRDTVDQDGIAHQVIGPEVEDLLIRR